MTIPGSILDRQGGSDLDRRGQSWRTRVEGIRGATMMSALTRYEQLSSDIEYIEEVLNSTAGTLSAHIDMQIDAAREDWPEPMDQ